MCMHMDHGLVADAADPQLQNPLRCIRQWPTRLLKQLTTVLDEV